MPNRYSFSSQFNQGPDPLFRVGNASVTLTALIAAINLVGLFASAVTKGTVADFAQLNGNDLASLEVWRLFTWPFTDTMTGGGLASLFPLISLVIFFMFGQMSEAELGRKIYSNLLLIAVGCAAVAGVTTALLDIGGFTLGLTAFNIVLFAAAAARRPTAPGFFGIPFWAITAVIIVFSLLQSLSGENPNHFEAILIVLSVAATLLFLRATGNTDEVLDFIPNLATANSGSGSKADLKIVNPVDENEMNRILDKVAAVGMSGLTRSEKKTLKEQSKKLRDS